MYVHTLHTPKDCYIIYSHGYNVRLYSTTNKLLLGDVKLHFSKLDPGKNVNLEKTHRKNPSKIEGCGEAIYEKRHRHNVINLTENE